jgi:hypothetical protein
MIQNTFRIADSVDRAPSWSKSSFLELPESSGQARAELAPRARRARADLS